MKALSASLLLAAALVVTTPAPAGATIDERTLHPDVVFALEAVPGGVALDSRHAVWPDGMEIVVPNPALRAVGACPTARVCAFKSSGATGTMLSWSTCGTHNTAALATVGSIANARTSGILQARNGSSVVAMASAGSWTNVFSTVTNVRCLQ